MAVRVGTTAHDLGGLRASSTQFEAFTLVSITDIQPAIARPNLTITVTTFDVAFVAAVYFAGVAQTFATPNSTTITFTAPDGFLYGNRPIRLEDSDGAGATVLHPYHPAVGNVYRAVGSDYPPGDNEFNDLMLHLGEGATPQPTVGAQIEVWNSEAPSDFNWEDPTATYSLQEDTYLQRRIIYGDNDASAWEDVYVNRIPEDNSAIAFAQVRAVPLTRPTGTALGTSQSLPTNLFTSPIAQTSARANWSAAA
jgi:hypothetical protein